MNPQYIAKNVALIAATYARNNALSGADLVKLVEDVRSTLGSLEATRSGKDLATEARSISRDHLVCLNCGGKFRTLKRHLSSAHNLSTKDYRSLHGLAPDYSMCAPAYSAVRQKLSRKPRPRSKTPPADHLTATGEVEHPVQVTANLSSSPINEVRPRRTLSLRL